MRHVGLPAPCIGHGPGVCDPIGQHLWEEAAACSCDALVVCVQHATRGPMNNAPTWSIASVSAHTRERRSALVMDAATIVGENYDARKHLRGP